MRRRYFDPVQVGIIRLERWGWMDGCVAVFSFSMTFYFHKFLTERTRFEENTS